MIVNKLEIFKVKERTCFIVCKKGMRLPCIVDRADAYFFFLLFKFNYLIYNILKLSSRPKQVSKTHSDLYKNNFNNLMFRKVLFEKYMYHPVNSVLFVLW